MEATAEHVSKYVNLLNTMPDDGNTMISFNVSILFSQRNPLNEKQSTQSHCQHCLTPWTRGNLTVKTIPKGKKKKSKVHKMKTTEKSFLMVTQCLFCLNVSCAVISKGKKLKEESIRKAIENSVLLNNINSTSHIAEDQLQVLEKKKKKKRNPYAGLNPLVCKNRKLNKKK